MAISCFPAASAIKAVSISDLAGGRPFSSARVMGGGVLAEAEVPVESTFEPPVQEARMPRRHKASRAWKRPVGHRPANNARIMSKSLQPVRLAQMASRDQCKAPSRRVIAMVCLDPAISLRALEEDARIKSARDIQNVSWPGPETPRRAEPPTT